MSILILCVLQSALAAPGTLETMGTSKVQVSLEQASVETPERKRALAQAAIEELAGAVREVDRLVEQAGKLPDAGAREDALKCLQPKATQLRALETLARKAQAETGTFAARGDGEHADQQFRKVLVALSRGRELLVEARGCGDGQGLVGTDRQVEVTGSSESLVEVTEEDVVTVEPPQASPN